MLAAKNIGKLIVQTPDRTDGNQATDRGRRCVSERALRSRYQNSLAISVMVLSERWNYMLVRRVVEAFEPLHRWHQSQNHRLRTMVGGFTRLVEQVWGGLGRMASETWQLAFDV